MNNLKQVHLLEYIQSELMKKLLLQMLLLVFSLFDINVYVLIDPGSTQSYICTALVDKKNLPIVSTDYNIKVTNPLGQCVLVNHICKSCPLKFRGYNFSVSLMLLPFDDFDLIFGMDWLKQVSLKSLNVEYIYIKEDGVDRATNMITTMSAHKLIRKGCEAYLAYVLNSKVAESKINQVPVIKEYADAFPKVLPRLSPTREVEFVIELVPGTTPISIVL
ncbi:RVP_2 domain-containing protein [Gossypium australe]|uniref:RVP_2 domain-containing protein n=1 Tax=Gossypium australe TaxID=47621 RepID=A0A5B6VY86_9ROSI|nr:RVP_2 domain-containing protein [Gossypium australe]